MVISDLERWAELLPTFDSVRALDPGVPAAVGARYEVRQPGLPKATYTVTDWRPGSGFTWVASGPGMRATATHEITAIDSGATLTLGVNWSGPLGRVLRTVLTKRGQPMVEQEADVFIGLAESG